MDILSLIGRSNGLFTKDVNEHQSILEERVSGLTFLVICGAVVKGQTSTNYNVINQTIK